MTTTLDLNNEQVHVNEYKPIPQGRYELEIVDAGVKVPKDAFNDKGDLKLPYVEVQFRVFGGSLPETGRKFSANLILGTKPGKDGIKNYQREGGLIALFKGLGASLPPFTTTTKEATNSEGNLVEAEMINPNEVSDAINGRRGERLPAYLKVKSETYNGKSRDKNEVKFLVRES
jgi:hypothetical protein